jgi:BASS family bile acid:Na+ symporter
MGDVLALTGPLFPALATAAVFTVMFALGLGLNRRELRAVLDDRGLVARGVFSVLVAVPLASALAVRAFGLPRWTEIGIVLMAISPGAPVALRRSLGAGGHRSFAPALQMLVAALAAVSMPASIAILNVVYAGHASIPPTAVAGQVLQAQLLPLGLGLVIRELMPGKADDVQRVLARAGILLLIVVAVMAIVAIGPTIVAAGPRPAAAIALVTVIAVALGHALGGPDPNTRTAVAICSAARNPGLALLVAMLNRGTPDVIQTVLAYLLVSAVTLIPYVAWRRRRSARSLQPGS